MVSPDDLAIRPAAPADAVRLAEIRLAAAAHDELEHPEGALIAHEVDFLDRLAIPHGEDYFCLVAEAAGRVVGYVIGGGSRDLDRKAHGEIYELAVAADAGADDVGVHLCRAAISAFDEAAFAGTLLSASDDDETLRELARRVGMVATMLANGRVRYEWRPGGPFTAPA